jgi:hypothetical protein
MSGCAEAEETPEQAESEVTHGTARSPVLGLEVWQGAGSKSGLTTTNEGGRDVVTFAMKPGPFQLRVPTPTDGAPVRITTWKDASIFAIEAGTPTQDHAFFGLGHGSADFPGGSGELDVDNEAHAFLTPGELMRHTSRVSQVTYYAVTNRVDDVPVATHLSTQKTALFMVVFIDKNANEQFDVGEYEYVKLAFAE